MPVQAGDIARMLPLMVAPVQAVYALCQPSLSMLGSLPIDDEVMATEEKEEDELAATQVLDSSEEEEEEEEQDAGDVSMEEEDEEDREFRMKYNPMPGGARVNGTMRRVTTT